MAPKKTANLSTRSRQKAIYRSKILDLIRTSELISRTDLAKETGLSQASITGITADLIEEGLIVEKQAGAYEGGRPPTLLAIRANGVYVIGVNLTLEQIRIVIIDFQAEIKASHVVHLDDNYHTPEEITECVAQGIQACMWEANFYRDQISGVGVGIPGLVNSEAGIVHFLPNYGWENVPFREVLRNKINHPVFIDNSSNNLAIGEYWHGSGKGVENFLAITLENGIGAGTIINGQLVRGSRGIASELGHICIDPDGPSCRCGKNGCIEAYSGNIAIIREARKLAQSGSWSSSGSAPDHIGYKEVLDELKAGNAELENIYINAARALALGIHNLSNLLNPELIIITGKGVEAGDFLFKPLFEILNKINTGKFGSFQTQITIKDWDDSDWAKGSGTLVLREIYKSPDVN
jgi:transcriptional regulator of PTS gene